MIGLFVREQLRTEIMSLEGTETVTTSGNVATLHNRGELPCMWWMDSPHRIIVGGDEKNPPIPYCENCPIAGGPIVKADSIVASRAYCEYFGSEKYYQMHSDGYREWCWGKNINPNGSGEAVWRFVLPKNVRKNLKAINLEISDKPTSNGRLHSNKLGDMVFLYVNDRQVSQYVLDKPTEYHEFVVRAGVEQPLDPEGSGKLLDITELVNPSTETVRIGIKVGPYTKWDISKVALHIKTRSRKLTELS